MRRPATQLGLFEAPPKPDPELERLAAALPKGLRFGTSSWTFEGWKGLVYREPYKNKAAFTQHSLAEYARYPLFRTVGVDRSYYAPVSAEDFARYQSQLPDDFRCVSKVASELVGYLPAGSRGLSGAGPSPSFLDPDLFIERVGVPTRLGLGQNAGPFLLQFPRFPDALSIRHFEDKLAAFLKRCAGDYRFAVELRTPRCLTERYFKILHHFGAAHCFNFWGDMPGLGAQQQAHQRCGLRDDSPNMVIRLLLPPSLGYQEAKAAFSPFDQIVAQQPAMRQEAIDLIRYGLLLEKEVYLLVNNKAEGSSPRTIRALAQQLTLSLENG